MFLSVRHINKIFKTILRPIGKGRKWTFFIVQSVPLVTQHANTLRRHLQWNVGAFSGDMRSDFFCQEQWDEVLEKCHVSTMII